MAQSARDIRISRRSWLLAGVAAPVFPARAAGGLAVTFDGDSLRVSAPQVHFVSGKALERLKNADTVVFVSQLTLFGDDHITVFRRPPADRFVVSYDIWEEKFSVTMPGAAPHSVSLPSAPAVETWCLENVAMSASGLAPDRFFWLRFELRTADQKDFSNVTRDPAISLRSAIDFFSRKPGADEPHWTLDSGRLRLADLPRTPGRGTRNG